VTALDFAIATVRRLTDEKRVRKQLSRWVDQGLTRHFMRRKAETFQTFSASDLMDELASPLPAVGDISPEEVVAAVGNVRDGNDQRILNREDRTLLLSVLRMREGETVEMIVHTRSQQDRWYGRILPTLRRWAYKEGYAGE
jgi:hypothetical protein